MRNIGCRIVDEKKSYAVQANLWLEVVGRVRVWREVSYACQWVPRKVNDAVGTLAGLDCTVSEGT